MDKLEDLNNLLFLQIKRLSKEDLVGKELDKEIERAKAMAVISSQFISSSSLQLRKALIMKNGNVGLRLLESDNGF